MGLADRPNFLRNVLFVDAATCFATGLVMTAGSSLVAAMTEIPAGLLLSAGGSLFPIGAFIAFVATRARAWPAGVWLVILGNLAWVAGSLWLAAAGSVTPNGLGSAFILMQAAAVAVLAALEFVGLRRITASA